MGRRDVRGEQARDEAKHVVHMTDDGFEPASVVEVDRGEDVVFDKVGGEGHWPTPTATRGTRSIPPSPQ
ncbi:MAG: hypothetical protein M3151_00065 [Actinomycetota bacterium]|nr:hypothetical protein [Actinomycetota bacterium]